MSEQQVLSFDAPSDDPVAAYLASGLTSLNEDQITIIGSVSFFVGVLMWSLHLFGWMLPPARLDEQRLVDRLMGDPHRRVVGKVQDQPR